MLRLFLDTNVVIDLFESDRVYHDHSLALFQAADKQLVDLFVSPITIINTVYVLRKVEGPSAVASKMKRVLSIVRTVDTSHNALLQAMDRGWSDIEDAVQYHTALSVGGFDALVTGDPGFPKKAELVAWDPQAAMAHVLKAR